MSKLQFENNFFRINNHEKYITNKQINSSYERLREMKPRIQDEIKSKSGKITS
jgi:hypothetical protein